MTRQVLYVAAPVRPTEEEIAALLISCPRGMSVFQFAIRANLDRAMRWLDWLRRRFPEVTFIAPWIASILAGADDSDPAQREAGMADNFAVIERCDGIVLCGGRISEGMRREMEHAEGCDQYSTVYDLTSLRSEPPQGDWQDQMACPKPWGHWAACFIVNNGRTGPG